MVPPGNGGHQLHTFLERHTKMRTWRKSWAISAKKQCEKGWHRSSAISWHHSLNPGTEGFDSKGIQKFHNLKKDDKQRDTWIAQLINAQSEAWNCSKKAIWKQLHCTEQIQKIVNNVCHALHKMHTHSPLAMVEAPGNTCDMHQEYHQKVELEKACLEEAS